MPFPRRRFLRESGAAALAFLGLRTLVACGRERRPGGYGPLIADPNKILDLPEGFSYNVLSQAGESMDDGFLVPGSFDGMFAFPGPSKSSLTILVRNHELRPTTPAIGPFGQGNALFGRIDRSLVYDAGRGQQPSLGGTTTLVYDLRGRKVVGQFLSLAGTIRNCSGGPTPWNSWVTCEETNDRAGAVFERDHGYNFEVPASTSIGLAPPIPLRAMGRFNHEAIAVDAESGAVYQTEDRGDGLLYRFVPSRPGQLAQGGRLQALKLRDRASAVTTNAGATPAIPVGMSLDVEWVDLEDADSPGDDLRRQGFAKGAATFSRGEGIWYSRGTVYFAATDGGANRKGQVWRYTRSDDEARRPSRLQLFIEPNDENLLDNVDNVVVAPWGDLVLCEDGPGRQFVVGVTPDGALYKIAQNALNNSEFAGATFSQDWSTMFVNIYSPGLTLAVTGPWLRDGV